LHQITDGTEKYPTDENDYIIGKALHELIAVPQPIQQTIILHIPERVIKSLEFIQINMKIFKNMD
jgi:hypothetical protein